MIQQEQLQDFEKRLTALRGYLDIDHKLEQIREEEKLTEDPDFWNDSKKAEQVLKQIRSKKSWTDAYQQAASSLEDLQVLFDFFKEGEATEEELDQQYQKLSEVMDDLEFRNMLSGEEDGLSAILQITAGAGGTESCDWAQMLMRMYIMWAENKGYKLRELDLQQGEVAGIKQVTIEVDGR